MDQGSDFSCSTEERFLKNMSVNLAVFGHVEQVF